MTNDNDNYNTKFTEFIKMLQGPIECLKINYDSIINSLSNITIDTSSEFNVPDETCYDMLSCIYRLKTTIGIPGEEFRNIRISKDEIKNYRYINRFNAGDINTQLNNMSLLQQFSCFFLY